MKGISGGVWEYWSEYEDGVDGDDQEYVIGSNVERHDPTGQPHTYHPIAEGIRREANARLFVGAPDLLAACKLTILACQKNLSAWAFKHEPSLLAAMQACEAAVAKAEDLLPGEQEVK